MSQSPIVLQAGEEYSEQSFINLLLEGVDLTRAQFTSCTFRHCQLRGIDLEKARFEDCTFESCDMSNAKVSGARFIDCVFRGTKALGIDWTRAQQPLFITLSGCNFAESIFQGLNLSKLSLKDTQFLNADFEQAKLKQANLSGSDFAGARFDKTDLSQADLRDATNYEIDPRANLIRRARFSVPEALNLLHAFEIRLD